MSDYTSRFYHKGETIFHEGFGGDSAFLVKSGQVGISRKVGDDSVPLAEFGPGEIFGEMAILLPGPRTATATMIEGGDLIHLPKDRFLEQLDQVPPIIRNTFYSLMNRLSATTDRLRPGRDHSLFVSVCRLLDQILDGLSGDKTKSLPYKDALRLLGGRPGVPLRRASLNPRRHRRARRHRHHSFAPRTAGGGATHRASEEPKRRRGVTPA